MEKTDIVTASRFKFYSKISNSIFIVMLHLYGTCEDTKIWAKIISAHSKKCRRIEVSVAEGRWVGQKGNPEQTSRDMSA